MSDMSKFERELVLRIMRISKAAYREGFNQGKAAAGSTKTFELFWEMSGTKDGLIEGALNSGVKPSDQ